VTCCDGCSAIWTASPARNGAERDGHRFAQLELRHVRDDHARQRLVGNDRALAVARIAAADRLGRVAGEQRHRRDRRAHRAIDQLVDVAGAGVDLDRAGVEQTQDAGRPGA
jgi:hypothetical protein